MLEACLGARFADHPRANLMRAVVQELQRVGRGLLFVHHLVHIGMPTSTEVTHDTIRSNGGAFAKRHASGIGRNGHQLTFIGEDSRR